MRHIREIIQALKNTHLRYKLPKYKFHVKKTEFLGYIITLKKFLIVPDKKEKILS